MTAPTTVDTPEPRWIRLRPRRIALYAFLVFAAVALAIAGRHLTTDAPVARVEVANPSEYGIKVEVANADGGSALPVGVAAPRTTSVFEDVLDQGDTWLVRFSLLDHAVEQRVARDALREARWHLDVPAELITELREAKVTPTPGPTTP
jgi:hypothetical protein